MHRKIKRKDIEKKLKLNKNKKPIIKKYYEDIIKTLNKVKIKRAWGGCLGTRSRRRTWQTTKCREET